MVKADYNRSYVYTLTLVATLGGFLFGYDTAVVSGAVSAIREFFIVPLSSHTDQVRDVMVSYRITVSAAVAVIVAAVSGMLIRFFDWRKGSLFSLLLLIVAASVLALLFTGSPSVSAGSINSITGFTVSSALIGCIIGGSLAGFISLALGRKKSMMLAALLFLLSSAGAAFPEKAAFFGMHPLISFIFYRVLGGIGIGLASMLSPMYIAEIAPASIRGKLVSWNQFAIVLGILVVYFVNWFIARMGNEQWNITEGWRYMFLSGSVPALLFFATLFLIPETPRYLVLKGRPQQALKVLGKTVGESNAETSLGEIASSMTARSAPWLSFGGSVILISIFLAAFQQFTGINVVLYYAPKIFQNTGTKLDVSLLQTVLVGVFNVVFTVIAILTVDRAGRKPLLIAGGAIMGLAMAGIGISFYAERLGIIALAFILLYIAGFAMSWGPVMWVLLSEIFPNSIRGAMSAATATVWISDLVISWTFPILDDNTWLNAMFHHGFAYWIYALICFCAVLFVWKMVPETKGKTLEMIEKTWRKR